MKLTKADLARRDALIARLGDRVAHYNAVVEAVNIQLEALDEAKEAVNETINEINGFAEDIANSIDQWISDRSDKWQEGDAGSAHQEWQSEWANFSLEEVEEVQPLDELEVSTDDLESLPEEPSV